MISTKKNINPEHRTLSKTTFIFTTSVIYNFKPTVFWYHNSIPILNSRI